ncbi:MAG TPA: thioredoxin family protein, partial [Flavobacterium sp.]|nr:thioredoxin family protein [Flavobacterium sp.]
MKTLFAFCAFFVLTPAFCQIWNENLEDALLKATAENKRVLLFFTVPDACESCVALEENVLQSPEFGEFASNFILARADFQHTSLHPVTAETKAKNLLIVEKYNKDGFFPLMVLLDKNGKVVGSRGTYNGESPAEY